MNTPRPPARSLRSINPKDPGYSPSPSVDKTFSTADIPALIADLDSPNLGALNDTKLAQTFRAYVTDVLDQYTSIYYADEDPELITDLVGKLTKLSLSIFFVANDDLYPDPTVVEAAFDDILELDGETFCIKYNIIYYYRLVEAYNGHGPKPSNYELLSRHLNQTNPEFGRWELDLAILESERIRAERQNRLRAFEHVALLNVPIPLATLCAALVAWIDQPHPTSPLMANLQTLCDIRIIALCATVIAIAAYTATRCYSLRQDVGHPQPPERIRAWLEAHDRDLTLRSWAYAYWPQIKLELHRRRFLGYTFWRRAILSRSFYEDRLERLRKARIFKDRAAYEAHRIEALLSTTSSKSPWTIV